MKTSLWLLALVAGGILGCSANKTNDDVPGQDLVAGEVAEDVVASDGQGDPDIETDCPLPPLGEPGLVLINAGGVQGHLEGDTWAWKGIPYARPPLGELRWRDPEPSGCFPEKVWDAAQFGEKCLQISPKTGAVEGTEDCLTLNIWAPADSGEGPWPVLFFLHGGGNNQGSSSGVLGGTTAIYGGQHLSSEQKVVVVTVNYRLGPMGFLALPELGTESPHGVSGNYGLRDQILALHWVQDHIARFGGDPSRVLLFGESAGAWDICCLFTSPSAAGLFRAALMQSGGCQHKTLAAMQTAMSGMVDSDTPCGTAPNRLACLRALEATELIRMIPGTSALASLSFGGDPHHFGPVVDGVLLPKNPIEVITEGSQNHVPLVLGTNAEEYDSLLSVPVPDEGAYEDLVGQTLKVLGQDAIDAILAAYPVKDYASPRAAAVDLLSDAFFTCPARTIARAAESSQEEPVYRYFFSRRPTTTQGVKPAYHGLELLYVFGTLRDIPLYQPAQEDLGLSAAMMMLWARFADTGRMDGAGVDWSDYEPASDPYLRLDAALASEQGLHTTRCDLWDSLLN